MHNFTSVLVIGVIAALLGLIGPRLDAAGEGTPAAARGGSPAGRQNTGAHFTSHVDLVVLDVHVSRRDGSPIEEIRAEEFVILEDGQPQRLSVFAPGADVPLAAVLLIDQSASRRRSSCAGRKPRRRRS